MTTRRSGTRLLKLLVAIGIALGAAQLEVARACRRPAAPGVTSEACVWGRAYLPLGRAVALVLFTPIVYGLLSLAEGAWRRRRGGRG
jgi:hypothetical protein